TDGEPDDEADEAAARRRAEKPPEDPAQESVCHPDEEKDTDQAFDRIDTDALSGACRLRLRRRQRLALGDADHPLDAGGDARVEVAFLEPRRDVFVDDPVRD